MNIREMLEENEKRFLSAHAQFSVNSKGRKFPLKPCLLRTEFQRDRDRIIHSKSFRRLSHKTQVFLAPEGDHYRNRLTHTLEVTQISRTIARVLRLNEDLTEAIALGHDLGHTPFGHTGEDALTECLQKIKKDFKDAPESFEHNKQSLRVVDYLEYEGKGLNLTWEVRDGILNHTGDNLPSTLEGQIVKIADRIAYINHDIDDAIRAGMMSEEDLPSDSIKTLGKHHGIRINNMVFNMVEASKGGEQIQLSDDFAEAMNELRNFLFEKIYINSAAKIEEPKAKKIVEMLFFYYLDHPLEMPEEFHSKNGDELPVKICDYVAGMTDRYALGRFGKLFMPKVWMS
ncbi:MAG TPA: deoxyguanosinetriphosphate triphosphohydrolase [Actinobacteria bacterium]|nr:deoxyguanosinetriphosphate triphosphohydrolase [Actinomycetota bacterium]